MLVLKVKVYLITIISFFKTMNQLITGFFCRPTNIILHMHAELLAL